MCLCMIWMMIESVDADLAPAPLFIQPYIIIVSEDEQCRKGGDTLERGRPGLSVLTSPVVSVDVKIY